MSTKLKQLLYVCAALTILLGISANTVYATDISANDVGNDTQEMTSNIVCLDKKVDEAELVTEADASLSEEEVYNRIMNLKSTYPEGMSCTNENFSYSYSVPIQNSYFTGYGCAGFAFAVSDAVFGSGQGKATKYDTFDNIRVGDILRINKDTHSVVVLKVDKDTITIVEGNYNSTVHWGRTLSLSALKADGNLQYGITRYYEETEPSNTCGTSLTYTISNGRLTISGTGDMNNYTIYSAPWYSRKDEITSIVIESGVTGIGKAAFAGLTKVNSVSIPNTVTKIGQLAFYNCTALTTLALPDSVTEIGENAFYRCPFYTATNLPDESDEDNPGSSDPVDVGAVEAFVSRMYTVALGRDAEEAGLNDWSAKLENQEIDGAGIAKGFIASTEFTNRNLSDSEFLDTLYRTFFDRDADEGGKSYWISRLNSGVSRLEVLSGFVNSEEFANLCDSYNIARGTMQADGSSIYKAGVRSYVLRMYTKALNRDGETLGVEDWSNRINTGIASAETVAKSFFDSDEFIARNLSNEEYVETLYQTFMDRASDEAGKADWVAKLNGGVSRTEVLEGFSRSREFANIMASYGL